MSLLRLGLRRQRTSIIAFSIGFVLWSAMYIAIFPLMRDMMANLAVPQGLTTALGSSSSDFANPRVFFDVELFSFIPSIIAIFAVIAGTAALAGEESSGTIDFLAPLPLTRRQLFAYKAASVVLGVAIVIVVMAIGRALVLPFAQVGDALSQLDFAGATLLQLPYELLVVGVALLLGAIAPSRSQAAAWTGAFVVGAFMLVAFAGAAPRVENLRYLSPYYYSDLSGILERGVQAGHQLVLLAMLLVVYALALRAFEGRELNAEHWQWRALLRGNSNLPREPSAPAAAGHARGIDPAA